MSGGWVGTDQAWEPRSLGKGPREANRCWAVLLCQYQYRDPLLLHRAEWGLILINHPGDAPCANLTAFPDDFTKHVQQKSQTRPSKQPQKSPSNPGRCAFLLCESPRGCFKRSISLSWQGIIAIWRTFTLEFFHKERRKIDIIVGLNNISE